MSNTGGTNQDTSEPTDKARAALARLAQVLADPKQRAAFLDDPHGTVEGYEQIPASVRETFEGLSHEELDLISRTHDTLDQAGFYVDTDGGRLGFF